MKYIIDIPKTVGMTEKVGSVHYTYFDGIQCQTIVLKSDEIEELNSDYINEHYGSLQDDAYQRGYKDCETRYCSFDACPNRKAEYKRGLEDAWECARELYLNGACKDLFGEYFNTFIKNHTAQEAIAKLKAYEEKQKEEAEDEIKVGDEVAFHHDDGRPDTVVVVTYIGQDGFIDGMDGRGTQYAHKNPTKWTKTGRHFDIASILEDMRND